MSNDGFEPIQDTFETVACAKSCRYGATQEGRMGRFFDLNSKLAVHLEMD